VKLDCACCGHVLEFSGERPSFCSFCGHALKETMPAVGPGDLIHEAATVAAAKGARPEEAPATVGGYRLVRRLGGGGMGEVYEAEDPTSGRRVALKLIAAEYTGSGDAVDRFRQEGRLASAVSHPRCVFVLAADEDAGRPFIVMELMPGHTLHDLVHEKGPLPAEQAVARIFDVIEGLQAAHQLGVIHRDVKPSNCFVEADGRVKVGDFGLAKSLLGDAHLTRSGAFVGTPLFASPEQIRREPLDAQTDVYSVAATLYFLLTGRAPFEGGDAASCIARIVSDDPPPVRSLRPEVPAALDRVVLCGLERGRKQRWHDLEEFRAALQPFVPGRITAAGLGVRFAAYLTDYVALAILTLLIPWPLLLPVAGTPDDSGPPAGMNPVLAQVTRLGVGLLELTLLTTMTLRVLYFGVLEGFWGWSPGKRLLGLRVQTVREMDVPGPGRAALRVLVLFLLTHLGGEILLAGLIISPAPGLLVWLAILSTPLNVVGIALLLCTMRGRNGYRGLHEFLSGTRTVWLPRARDHWTVPSRALDADAAPPNNLPPHLGPFDTHGVLSSAPGWRVLLGQDPTLGRRVLLRLGPPDQSPGAARRDLNRPSRPRWLVGGRLGDDEWDAFLAPAGCSLPKLVAENGPLPWPRVRPLLERLADELAAAQDDHTLPGVLTAGQVWVQPDGGVLLLDWPLGSSTTDTQQTPRPLELLGRVAVLALEGAPRPPTEPPVPVRAPLPLHAAAIVNRLLGVNGSYQQVDQFRAALRATRDSPTAVTPSRRAAHQAILAACLSLPAGIGVVVFLMTLAFSPPFFSQAGAPRAVGQAERAREALEAGAARELAASAVNPDPWVRLAGVCQWDADQGLTSELHEQLTLVRQQQQSRLRCLSPVSRGWLTSFTAQGEQLGRGDVSSQEFRKEAQRDVTRLSAPPGNVGSVPLPVLYLVGGCLFVVVLIAALSRGGVGFRLADIRVVRSDGRPASRLRCALRALLAWGPFAGLVLMAVGLDAWHLATWPQLGCRPWLTALAGAAWWAAVGVLPLQAALALWSPDRSWHDRVTGTFLVPR
jgi:hypothetical protein